MMTRQEAFDKAVLGVLKQGGPSIQKDMRGGNWEFVCAYRGPNGAKCAIGHLIPDEKYSPIIEGHRAASPMVASRIEYRFATTRFLAMLQEAHDRATLEHASDFMNCFKEDCRKVAKEYQLDDSILDSPL